MLVKLKTECGEFHFMRRLVIQVIVSIAVAHVQLDYLLGQFPESRVKVGKYSMGMKQRLAIAQALMEKPSLLILDEPFNAIDSSTVEDFRHLLWRLNTEDGVTIIMTSHHPEDMDGLCGSMYQIESG